MKTPKAKLPDYYVWCDGSCDNKTNDLEVARRWEKEFLDAHREAYIVDVDNNIIDETFVPEITK